jgi:branched-chain amino acid transport system permease protein
MAFFLETLLGGLMAGMLYSLVALGFVLIYKASGVFNFRAGRDGAVRGAGHGALFRMDSPAGLGIETNPLWPTAGVFVMAGVSCSWWPG